MQQFLLYILVLFLNLLQLHLMVLPFFFFAWQREKGSKTSGCMGCNKCSESNLVRRLQ